MSIAEILEHLKVMTNVERLTVLETAAHLIRADLANPNPSTPEDLKTAEWKKRSRALNAIYRRLKPTLDATYPKGHFIGLDGEEVVATGETLKVLHERLAALGRDGPHIFIAQAGDKGPGYTRAISPISPL